MPDVDLMTNVFLVLALAADVVVVVGLVAGVAVLVSRRARVAVVATMSVVGRRALPAALVVAVVTTAGSLYYSEHAGFTPCELCWYQRILMYPLVIVLAVGCIRRSRGTWMTAALFVVIGAPISLYHWLVERVPSLSEGSSCSALVPCNVPYFEKLGFATLAWMCLSSFGLVGVLLASAAVAERASSRTPPRGMIVPSDSRPSEMQETMQS